MGAENDWIIEERSGRAREAAVRALRDPSVLAVLPGGDLDAETIGLLRWYARGGLILLGDETLLWGACRTYRTRRAAEEADGETRLRMLLS